MGWREWMDAALAAGCGPEDFEEPECDPPSEVVVTVWLPVEYYDPDCCCMVSITAPHPKSWPLYCEKAAMRWADWARRKYGAKNVTVDWE